MNPILRNILACLIGVIIGMIVNMGLIVSGLSVFPYPDGIDPNDMLQLKELFKDASLKYYIFPFLAHAIGTLAGAFVGCKLAINNKLTIAIVIGAFFLIGGIMINYNIQGPSWFIFMDLSIAYFPMAFLGKKLAGSKSWFSAKN